MQACFIHKNINVNLILLFPQYQFKTQYWEWLLLLHFLVRLSDIFYSLLGSLIQALQPDCMSEHGHSAEHKGSWSQIMRSTMEGVHFTFLYFVICCSKARHFGLSKCTQCWAERKVCLVPAAAIYSRC